MNDGLVHVDMSQIQERPQLTTPGPYTFTVVKAEVRDTKNEDSQLVYAELVPQESPEHRVFQRWSLKLGALQARGATMSFRKFLDVMGIDVPQGPFNPNIIAGARFSSTVKLDTYIPDDPQVKLDRIIGPAA